jgi:hypothetical protein
MMGGDGGDGDGGDDSTTQVTSILSLDSLRLLFMVTRCPLRQKRGVLVLSHVLR